MLKKIGLLDHALVSRIDQKIQCFFYRHNENDNGFVIGQSSSCHGLNNVEDGERIIHLIPGDLFGNTTFRHMPIRLSRFTIVSSPYEPVHHSRLAMPVRKATSTRAQG